MNFFTSLCQSRYVCEYVRISKWLNTSRERLHSCSSPVDWDTVPKLKKRISTWRNGSPPFCTEYNFPASRPDLAWFSRPRCQGAAPGLDRPWHRLQCSFDAAIRQIPHLSTFSDRSFRDAESRRLCIVRVETEIPKAYVRLLQYMYNTNIIN